MTGNPLRGLDMVVQRGVNTSHRDCEVVQESHAQLKVITALNLQIHKVVTRREPSVAIQCLSMASQLIHPPCPVAIQRRQLSGWPLPFMLLPFRQQALERSQRLIQHLLIMRTELVALLLRDNL
jgi:hypothetical protein